MTFFFCRYIFNIPNTSRAKMVGWSGGGSQDPWYQRLEKKSSRQRQMERSIDSEQGPKRAVMSLVAVVVVVVVVVYVEEYEYTYRGKLLVLRRTMCRQY